MPNRRKERPDPAAMHQNAQVAALSGLARGDDVEDIVLSIYPYDVQHWFTPDVAILELAVTALQLATPTGSEPLEYEGLRERYLPELRFRGRVEHRSSQYALYAAACMRGGLQPDLLNDAGWWQTRLWIYAVYALIIYVRAAAERLAESPEDVVRRIAERHDLRLEVEKPSEL
ncbi:MAG TPA: hypothetical protein VFX41_05015 [Actinomycetales bacterium]|nr:hypothetical protein [Actinomycetales bacterium]